jgi:hypothetical protein
MVLLFSFLFFSTFLSEITRVERYLRVNICNSKSGVNLTLSES